MTLLTAYKAGTPLKSGPVSWVKEVTEPHLPKGWTKYGCKKNGKKINKLVQYRDSDGKKYKSLRAVEDYLSEIIIRNNWQNVAPWNEFLKRMITAKNQKPAYKMPNPVGRPRKDKTTSTANPSQISQPPPPLTTPPPPPQRQPALPNPFPGGLASELMVTNHFRARRPPGPPGPASPQPVVQTTLPADEIKLEPEEFNEEPTDTNPSATLEIAVPPSTDDQKKTVSKDKTELVLPNPKTQKIAPKNTSDQNSTLTTDLSKETCKKFQCSVCHLIFEDKMTLVKHLTVHQQCNICNILFRTKGTWIKHMENVHKEDIQKKKLDSKNSQKPNESSDLHVQTNDKLNEMLQSDGNDAKDSLMETVPIKLEASPILSEDQLNVNRKRLTSIGDALEEDQNEIELSFSHKSSEKKTEADKPTEIQEEPLNTSNLILEESLDDSNMVLDESTAGVVENKSLPVNEINKGNKDIVKELNRESKSDDTEVGKESEKKSNTVSTENYEEALRWYDGTFFTCRVMKSRSETCGKEFIGRKPFRLHLGHDHGVKLKTNELNGLKSFASKSKEGTYKCKSCSKLVKHDLFGISHHLMKTHSLTIDDYARQFETVQSRKPYEGTKVNNEDAKNIEPIQSYKPVEGNKEDNVDGKTILAKNPEIILKKTKLNSQIVLGEKQLKENEKHIRELNVSNSTESAKISESSNRVEILKSEVFERIAAILMEKEALLKKAREYDEVIMENSNQIAKIEQVNNNRMSVLEKRSGEIMENIRKAKGELVALLNEKEEKIKPEESCNLASIQKENILVEADQENGLKKSNVEENKNKEPEPKKEIRVAGIKDEKDKELEEGADNLETTAKTTIDPTKQKPMLANRENKSEALQDKQEVARDKSIEKNKDNNEKPPKKGSILEQKIKSLKRISVGKDLVKEPSSEPDEDSGDSSEAESVVTNSTAVATNPNPLKRGRKKISEDVRNALKGIDGDNSSVEGPVEKTQVEESQPKKRGRKKLSDEEKAARKALRIDSKRLSNTKPTTKELDNSFVFEDIETGIPGVPCVPAVVLDKNTEKTGSNESQEKSEEFVEKKIDGTETASNAFQNVQDSIDKSKKKLQPKNPVLEPQRAVRDLTDLFAEIDEESDMLEKKGDETKEKTDNSSKGTQGVIRAIKKGANSNKNRKKRKNIHMSNGNVEGAQLIENINKKGRNSL